jgi:tetratricopeptide (TPR) repeat protein
MNYSMNCLACIFEIEGEIMKRESIARANLIRFALASVLTPLLFLSLAASETFARDAVKAISSDAVKSAHHARSAAALQMAQNLSERVGRYEGTALNLTAGQTGRVALAITRIDRSGNASAVFSATDGLCGFGNLSGKITGQRIAMSGELVCNEYRTRMYVTGSFVSSDTIEAQYTLERVANIPQQAGRFRVTRSDNGANSSNPPNQSSDSAQTFFNRGVEYERAQNYQAALEAYQQAIRLNPNYAEAYFRIGTIVTLQGDAAQNASDKTRAYTLAAQFYQRAAQANRSYAEAYVGLGNAYLNLRQFANAMAACRQALNLNPKNFYANAILGVASYQMGNFPEAINALSAAVQLKPDYVPGYLTLSVAYSRQARYEEAIEASRRALNYDPNNADAYVSLSWYYSLTDQPQQSLEAAKNAVRIKPNEQMGYTNMCRAYVDLKQPQAALSACRQALMLKPDDPETLNYMGYAYNDLGQKQRATESFTKSAAGFESGLSNGTINDPDAYYILGNSYRQLGEYANAIRAYRRCIELKPNFSLPHLSLGLTYVLAGDKQSARAEYTRLREIDADKAEKLLKVINSRR